MSPFGIPPRLPAQEPAKPKDPGPDPRCLEPDAYVSDGIRLYRVIGPEIEDDEPTGRHVLEDAHGEFSATGGPGTFVHKTRRVTEQELGAFRLIQAAPDYPSWLKAA